MVSVVYDGLGFNLPSPLSLVLFILIVYNYGRVGLEEYYVLFCDYIENPNEILSAYIIYPFQCVTRREMLLTTNYEDF